MPRQIAGQKAHNSVGNLPSGSGKPELRKKTPTDFRKTTRCLRRFRKHWPAAPRIR